MTECASASAAVAETASKLPGADGAHDDSRAAGALPPDPRYLSLAARISPPEASLMSTDVAHRSLPY